MDAEKEIYIEPAKLEITWSCFSDDGDNSIR